MVLAHDDRLACVDGVVCLLFIEIILPSSSLKKLLDSLQPDVLIEHLRNSVPEIQQVQCGKFWYRISK